tara:strand:+ start:1224 stop:1541 length:318 start_codon:yes stop_codon:yes gene_type:complete
MKLTKKLLKSIILEQMKEYDLPGIDDTGEEEEEEEEATDEEQESEETKTQLKQKFEQLRKDIGGMSGLSKNEITLFSQFVDTALSLMQTGEARIQLQRALDKLQS